MSALLLAAALHTMSVATERQGPPVFRAEIGMVVLHASVRDGHGRLVTDLDRGAFQVYENGRPQAITLFRPGDVPISVGLLLDNSRSIRPRRPAVEAAALAVLNAARPQDEEFVMNFADKARVDGALTGDVHIVKEAVHRSDALGGTALRDAVTEAARYLAAHAARTRRVLIVVSDGNDNASAASEEDVETATEHGGIPVYSIGLLNTDDAGMAGRGRQALERLSESTGGVAYFPPGLPQAEISAAEVARQVRQVYTIGYTPLVQALDGSYRKLRVVARGPEQLWVTTRPGYRAVRR